MAEWRAIPGFRGYEASDEGEIRSTDRAVTYGCNGHSATRTVKGRILMPQLLGGYLRVGITSDEGKRRFVFVHRLVLLAFHGPPPTEEHQASHGPDPDRENNRPENLRWHTRAWNQLEMRERNHRPLTYDPIAFLVEEAEVDRQARREGWSGVSDEPRSTDDEVPF